MHRLLSLVGRVPIISTPIFCPGGSSFEPAPQEEYGSFCQARERPFATHPHSLCRYR